MTQHLEMTEEQRHAYLTNPYFKSSADHFMTEVVPAYLEGLLGRSREYEARLHERMRDELEAARMAISPENLAKLKMTMGQHFESEDEDGDV